MGEKLAQNLLKNKRYTILETNFTTPLGEIDILAQDGSIIVICEVKTKSGAQYGLAKEMVTPKKQEKLKLLGKYIETLYPKTQIRFDVVAIDYQDQEPKIEHIINAFN